MWSFRLVLFGLARVGVPQVRVGVVAQVQTRIWVDGFHFFRFMISFHQLFKLMSKQIRRWGLGWDSSR